MGFVVAAIVALAQLLAAPASASEVSQFERLMFSTPLTAFANAADARRPSVFDWSTDLCSAPFVGNSGRSFDFSQACRRHDFGYRNLKSFDARDPGPTKWWTSQWRSRVDEQFRKDMKAQCATRPITQKFTCNGWAEVFYRLVRTFGGP